MIVIKVVEQEWRIHQSVIATGSSELDSLFRSLAFPSGEPEVWDTNPDATVASVVLNYFPTAQVVKGSMSRSKLPKGVVV